MVVRWWHVMLMAAAIAILPRRLAAIVRPVQRMRNDAEGKGHFGAPRGARAHQGIDLLVRPGNLVYSPVNGRFVRVARPYATGAMLGAVLHGEGYEVKIFYMEPLPELRPGDQVQRGQVIGTAQAVSEHYQRPAMRDHLHVEVRRIVGAELLDPASVLRLS